MRRLAQQVTEEEKESLAELSLFTNTSLSTLMNAGKYTTFMKEYLANLSRVERPDATILKSVKLEPQLLIPEDSLDEAPIKVSYKRLICFASENMACLERDDQKQGLDIVELNHETKVHKVIFRLDKKVRVVLQHGDRLIIDSMIFKFKEDGSLAFL